MDKLKRGVPTAVQVVGLLALFVGLYLMLGLTWVLVLGGLVLIGVGYLAEINQPTSRRQKEARL